MYFVGCRREIYFFKCLFSLFLLVCCWKKRKANLLHYRATGGNEIQCEFLTWRLCNAGCSQTSLLWVGGWLSWNSYLSLATILWSMDNNCTVPLRPCWTFLPPFTILSFHMAMSLHFEASFGKHSQWKLRVLTKGAGEGSSTRPWMCRRLSAPFQDWEVKLAGENTTVHSV